MPRIYDSYGDPIDLCMFHFPKTEVEAEKKYRDFNFENSEEGRLHERGGNGGWGYNSEHPCYEDEVYIDDDNKVKSNYTCDVCHCVLRGRDEREVLK